MGQYYDKDGAPLSMGEWAEKLNDREYSRVALTTIGAGPGRVSTVWLGLDHSFGSGPPLIFESMYFPADDYADVDSARYSTLEEAIAGHAQMVARAETRW